jgi:DNA-binding transcriptional LysR family regulator
MMNLSLRQLRAFALIGRLGSFTEAAKHLHLTQSATSGLLRELERQLGIKLLDRNTRSATLTAAGQEFLLHAQRILADVAQAVASAQGLASKTRGRVTVAASPLVSASLLPQVIREFAARHPQVEIVIYDVLTNAIIDHVRSGAAELGVGTFPTSHTELEFQTLFEDRLGVVLPPKLRLGSRRGVAWSDLHDQANIALTPGSAFRPLIDSTFRNLGVVMPAPRLEVGYMGTAVAMVEAGLGICVLPERAAALIRRGKARWMPLTQPRVTQTATLAKRAGKSLSPAASAFAAVLAERR